MPVMRIHGRNILGFFDFVKRKREKSKIVLRLIYRISFFDKTASVHFFVTSKNGTDPKQIV